MSSRPTATLQPAEIVLDCDFESTITVDPPPGSTNAEIITILTGATASVSVVDSDGTEIIPAADVTAEIHENDREIAISIAAADLDPAQIDPGDHYVWRASVTKAGSTWPLTGMGRAKIRAIPGP